MTDLAFGGLWAGILVAGIAACVIARAIGVASTYVRDVLHIGAGIWILGWPWWDGALVPVVIVACAALATAAMPHLARHSTIAARIVRSVTGGDERWTGLVHYTFAYAAFTTTAMVGDPFPAAAALWSLSLGDGIGGAVGRRFGSCRYQMPGAKVKSLEGSLAVLVAAAAGAWSAGQLFAHPITFATALGLGLVASAAEALAPRSTDNLLIPIAVWTTATLVT